ncbi:non-specific lipid-transfer protein 1-like [Solanum dulcamara]|uniref:non-specific lipid-transfer protein 1-like n=1 Tax=Solanum dulcamara TaxID=45834 RepID=UPI0024855EB7|nr:non-specific lipid-transfer protein 1-like [Solanum dulcamara]
MLNKQLFPLLLVCIVVATATTTAASTTVEDATVTCNTVYSSLEPCLPYVLSGGSSVPLECCNGLKSLLNTARIKADRQSVCKCIKSVASSANGVQIGRAAQLPGICKVNVPYQISPNVDCSKIT